MAAYRKILVLLDLSEGSEQVFAAGRDMAAHSNAEIVALHVVEYVPAEPLGESLMPITQIETSLAERSRALLSELVSRHATPRTRSRVEIGNTKAEILRVAILVNFTEDTVLHAAHCDVLAVRLS
jgi:universal stress protein A